MCERTCPRCKSTQHIASIGIVGTSLVCEDCMLILAHRFDPEAAPLGMSDEEAEAYALERSGVRPGAEAKDPADDEAFTGTAAFAPLAA